MTSRLRWSAWVLWVGSVLVGTACECRPVPPTNWTDLRIQCTSATDFAANGSDQVILESEEDLRRFLQFDCMPNEPAIPVPEVDFSRRVVIVDVTRSPLTDGTCVRERRVGQVEACVGGVQILYDDTEDPDCAQRRLTGAISINREDVRAAFSTDPL